MFQRKKRVISIKRNLHLMMQKWLLHGRFNEGNVYLITSTPRSGSTLLSNILNTIPQSCVLFEPMHLNRVPESKAAGFKWRTFHNPEVEWTDGKNFLSEVFKGNIINHWTAREIRTKDAFTANKLIVKSVRANRLLPWICHNFEIPIPILLIRHPCAVVASQLKSSNWNKVHKPFPKNTFFQYYFKDLQAVLETCDPLNNVEEYLAISWALDLVIPLSYKVQYPLIILTYEELLLNTISVLTEIKENWDVDLPIKKALQVIQSPSSVVYKSGISGIDGWKKQLSEEQVARILKVVHGFGLSFYNDNLTADLNKLNNINLLVDNSKIKI